MSVPTAASHYPHFDVLDEQSAWDEYSRSTVRSRLAPTEMKLLDPTEVTTLRAVVANLLYESRPHVIDFIVSNIDERLSSPVGEGERKPKVPPQDVLIRQGLAFLDAVANHWKQAPRPFHESEPSRQALIMETLQKGKHLLPPGQPAVPQKDLFKKLLQLAVEAYASHPDVWSEIGYAGPAYPRGYYRIEVGLTDPWEARSTQFPERNGEVVSDG